MVMKGLCSQRTNLLEKSKHGISRQTDTVSLGSSSAADFMARKEMYGDIVSQHLESGSAEKRISLRPTGHCSASLPVVIHCQITPDSWWPQAICHFGLPATAAQGFCSFSSATCPLLPRCWWLFLLGRGSTSRPITIISWYLDPAGVQSFCLAQALT